MYLSILQISRCNWGFKRKKQQFKKIVIKYRVPTLQVCRKFSVTQDQINHISTTVWKIFTNKHLQRVGENIHAYSLQGLEDVFTQRNTQYLLNSCSPNQRQALRNSYRGKQNLSYRAAQKHFWPLTRGFSLSWNHRFLALSRAANPHSRAPWQ